MYSSIFTYITGPWCKCWYIFQPHGSHMRIFLVKKPSKNPQNLPTTQPPRNKPRQQLFNQSPLPSWAWFRIHGSLAPSHESGSVRVTINRNPPGINTIPPKKDISMVISNKIPFFAGSLGVTQDGRSHLTKKYGISSSLKHAGPYLGLYRLYPIFKHSHLSET